MGTLKEIRVLRIGDAIAAASCSKLLRGFGASTQSVVAPDDPPLQASAAEAAWFEFERDRITFDWSAAEAHARFSALLKDCDVLLDASRPGTTESRGFDAARLRQQFPQLIICRITPFGSSGPYRDYAAEEITLYAMSGLMQSTGDPAREPLNSQPRIASLSGGLHAYCAVLLALLRRDRDVGGEAIDLSLHESAMENYEIAIAEHLHAGGVARRNGDEHNMVPWRTYACADGEAAVIGGPIRHWPKLAALIGNAEISEHFSRADVRMKERKAFEAQLKPWLQQHTRRELFHLGQRIGMAWSYLASVQEALDDPQHAARDFFEQQGAPDGHAYRMPRQPFGIGVMTGNGAANAKPEAKVPAAAASERAPLHGLRVLDFTHDWAGPHAARVLADFGADVIKVEYPLRLDGMRGGYPGKVNEFVRVWQLHRNKRSLSLDLQRADHLAFCKRLLKDVDLVIDNSRPGVMDKLGLGYEALRAVKPDIVMLSMSAFGTGGPYHGYAGYGGSIEAISGLQALTAYSEDSPRFRVREVDALNGIFGVCAALTALLHRQRSGAGQWLDVSETETTCWLVGEFFAEASASGREPAVIGNRHATFAPQGCYRCSGEDRWLTISIRDDARWRQLATIIGGTALADDPRYASVAQRRRQHDALDALIGAWTQTRDAHAAMHELQAAGIAAGVVCNTRDLANDPHLAARHWFQQVGDIRLPGLPFHLQRGGAQLRWRGPDLGQHNAELAERYGDLQIGDMLTPAKIGTAYQ